MKNKQKMEKLKRKVLYSQICVAKRKQIDHFTVMLKMEDDWQNVKGLRVAKNVSRSIIYDHLVKVKKTHLKTFDPRL